MFFTLVRWGGVIVKLDTNDRRTRPRGPTCVFPVSVCSNLENVVKYNFKILETKFEILIISGKVKGGLLGTIIILYYCMFFGQRCYYYIRLQVTAKVLQRNPSLRMIPSQRV